MSLSKIGKVSNAVKLLKAAGNMSAGVNWISKYGKVLDSGIVYQALKQAFPGESLTEEMLSKIGYTAGNASGKVGDAVAGAGLIASLKDTGTGLISFLKPFLPVIIGAAVAGIGYTGFKALDNQIGITKSGTSKKYQETKEKHETAQSDYEEAKSQYDSNQDRIYELRAKQNKSFSENQELNTLQNQNELLGAQVNLKERLAKTAKIAEADAAQKDLKKKYNQQDYFTNKDGVYNPQSKISINDIDEAQAMIDYIQGQQDRYDTAYNNIKNRHGGDITKITEDENKTLEKQQENIDRYKNDLSDKITGISESAQSLVGEDGKALDAKYQGTLDQIDTLVSNYTDLIGSASDTEGKLNNLFALADYADFQSKLENIGKSKGTEGILDALKNNDTVYADLKTALEDRKISEDDLASYIMSIADPEAKNIEGIKQNFKDIMGGLNTNDNGKSISLYDAFFKDKSDKEIEGFWNYLQSQDLKPKDENWSAADYSHNLDEYVKSQKQIDSESTLFSSKFKNSAEDTATDLDTITDNFQTDMSNIKSSMDSIKSGTFQNSDITDLIQQFPELATETDNLQQGLQKLTFDKASTAIGKIRDSVKDVTDPKELAAADKYIQSIMDTMDLSSMSMKDMKSQIRSNVSSNAENEHMVPQVLENLLGQYGNDKYAVQAILKLSVDPNFVNDSVEDQISKIEDTKVQVHIDVDTDKLDTLSKSLTRLQTEASQMQTDMNDKATLNQKVTAQDYTDLINNGKKQINNLNQQIAVNKDLQTTVAKGSEQYKQYQDQIDAANSSIQSIKVSQVEWGKTAFNLPVTDMQNTVTALTSAISEMQTETGLTSDTMDSLRTQFSDLKGAHVDNVFDRTAKGLKINTERMKDYLEKQNEFMNSDFAQRVQDYQNALKNGQDGYTQQGLENLKNLQAQYFAQYQEAAKQFSDFQAMVNADNLATEGNEYTTAQNYLKNAKDLYDKGLVGTPQFKAAAKYFSQNGFEDADNFIENYNKLKNYYTDDASGPKRFLNDLEAKGLATYQTLEDGSKQWMYSFTDTQDAADAMGMSLESFQSMFGRLGDYGFTNNFVSSLEEGALKTDEINDKLVAAQEKYAKMKARGATQSALDDQQAVIDDLESQQQGIVQATSDYASGAAGRKVQDLKEAKSVIDDFSAKLKEVGEDSDLGKAYIDTIQKYADENGIKLNNFEIDEASYNQMLESYEAKARGSQIKHFQDVNEGIESGNTGDYSDSDVELVTKIKDAQEQKSEALQNVIDAVNSLDKDQWNEANQIELGNGAYESEDQGIRNVENALQGLSDQFGLTKEQAAALLPALEALGVVNIDPNVDMTGLDELDEATQEGMASLRQMQANGEIDLSFKIDSSTDGLTIDELQSQIDELEKSKVELKLDVDSPEYNAIQSMIDQREAQIHLQVLMDQSTDIDKWLALANGEDGDKQLAIAAGIDLNDEDAQSKIDALKASLKSLSGESANLTVKIDETQFNQLTATDKDVNVTAHAKGTDKVQELVDAINDVKSKVVNVRANVFGTGLVKGLSGAIDSVNSKSVTVTVTTNHVDNYMTSGAKGASNAIMGRKHASEGTFKAASTGSAYNVLNMTPAHAKGTNVAIKENQQALVNEIGMNGHAESIVRDGVWSLLPGGAHIENLKKGDIVFSTTQTDALLRHGAIQGHARAYAQGTVSTNGIAAFGSGSLHGGGAFQGGASSTPAKQDSNTNANTNALNKNTNAVNNNSKSTSTAIDELIKKFDTNVKDWIEIAIDRTEKLLSRYQRNAESDYTGYHKSDTYYKKSIETLTTEISQLEQSLTKYKEYSDQVATGVGLSADLKQKVQNGTIDIQQLTEEDKKRVDAYQNWWNKYLDAQENLETKRQDRLDLAKARVENVYERYDAMAGKHSSTAEYYKTLQENRVKHGLSQYPGAKNPSIWYKEMGKQYDSLAKEKKTRQNEAKQVKDKMKEYLKTPGAKKTDKAYLELVKSQTELKTTIISLDNDMLDLKQAMEDAREEHLQWKVDRWERAGSKQDAVINYKKITTDPTRQISEKDYTERIKSQSNQMVALENKRQQISNWLAQHYETSNNEEYQKKAEELASINKELIQGMQNIEEWNKEILALRWKPIDDLQDKLSTVVSELQTAQKLLGDADSFYNDDGSFTQNGLTNILLIQEQIDTTKDKLANYRESLNNLDKLYKAGWYSADEYNQKHADILKNLQQESSTLADLKQNMLDMYTTQVTKENDLLQKNIDKRKDALSAKEKYYDYDKTLKKKSKDINTLKAQIAALEGTSSAASKARLEKLRAELSDAEDDMADTMHQHEVDMKNTGYENLSESANKALDNTLDAVKKNAAFQNAIISNMLSNVTSNYDSTYKHLGDVMDSFGMKVSQTFDQMITKTANFNTAAVNATKAWQTITSMNTSAPYKGSQAAQNAGNGAIDRNDDKNGAGDLNEGNKKRCVLKLDKHTIYLLDGGKDSVKLKASWTGTPADPKITWTSSDEKVAIVNKSGKVTARQKLGKTIITASGDGSKDTCTAYVIRYSVYTAMKEFAANRGLSMSDDELRAGLEYGYNSKGKTQDDYNNGLLKAKLSNWFNALPARPEGTGNIPDGTSGLASYFMKKGKKVNRNNLQELANILGIKTPGASNYESWGSSLKNKILNKYKSYGFSKGGIVRNGIPASILDMIGADALIPRGDSTLIGANPGETILTEEFTKQLKPTVATLNEFNERMARTQPLTSIPSNNTTNNVSDEYNFTINVASISGDQDIKQLAYKISDIIADRSKRNMRKL